MIGKSFRQLAVSMALAIPMLTGGATSAFADDSYGAIARSPSTADKGYAWNYGTRAAAERRAINECNSLSGGSDCKALLWFRNACGSIAESSEGAAGTGWGTSTALAERYALESCSGVGSGCTVTRTFCTE